MMSRIVIGHDVIDAAHHDCDCDQSAHDNRYCQPIHCFAFLPLKVSGLQPERTLTTLARACGRNLATIPPASVVMAQRNCRRPATRYTIPDGGSFIASGGALR